ncbi:43041_t:CDS:2 [Gigaspora margarita]|uniref:43041_t:CDS:1 n=1 Tax=Gigaspora margarita TaxID=4874 RepID=A0ABN7UHR1_GIGMA|nr:43041_t:CDS:2 [Gigaspora margarita]
MASESSTNNSITSTHTLTNNSDEEVKVMVPPLNFAMVAPGVYRSGHPNRKNFPFLKKLKLKSIMCLSSDEFHEELSQFVKDQNIQIFHYKIDGNKEPFIEIEQKEISNALVKVLGCLRKLQKWSLTSIFHEYRRFAVTKVLADQEFIEIFSEHVPYNPDFKPDWL